MVYLLTVNASQKPCLCIGKCKPVTKCIYDWWQLNFHLFSAGILLMMALCDEVHVYEYIPSVRQTDLCHYHERYFDAACTLGAYHPLLYEKMLVQRINTGPARDLRTKGKVTLPGFSTVQCDP